VTLLADLHVPPVGEERAARLVPCDSCGAGQHQPCATPGGASHGARRLLAVERGHLDPGTGEWLTRGWWS
jgi:hypothetical protein